MPGMLRSISRKRLLPLHIELMMGDPPFAADHIERVLQCLGILLNDFCTYF